MVIFPLNNTIIFKTNYQLQSLFVTLERQMMINEQKQLPKTQTIAPQIPSQQQQQNPSSNPCLKQKLQQNTQQIKQNLIIQQPVNLQTSIANKSTHRPTKLQQIQNGSVNFYPRLQNNSQHPEENKIKVSMYPNSHIQNELQKHHKNISQKQSKLPNKTKRNNHLEQSQQQIHRKKTNHKHHMQRQSDLSSNLQYSSQHESKDSFQQFKEYKKRKKSSSIKFLIKKVEGLQKQVKQLKYENVTLQKSKQKKLSQAYSSNKHSGIISNLISVKFEPQNVHIKEDILAELKRLRQKVQNLQSKSIDISRFKQNQIEQPNFSPVSSIVEKHQNLSNLITQQKLQKQTGKILKKSEMKQAQVNLQMNNDDQYLDKPQFLDNINQAKKQSANNKQKRGDAITIMKQLSKQKISQDQNILNNPQKQDQQQQSRNIPSKQNQQKQSIFADFSQHKLAKTSSNLNKQEMIPTKDDHGFKRSGKPIPNINITENVSKSDWQESLKMLQFDTGKQKILIDINNTSDQKKISRLSKNLSNQIYTFQDAEQLIPSLPKIRFFPNYDTPEEQLIEIGKQLFSLLQVQKINDQSTVLNVKKYKNCTYFGIDPQNNILLYYEGKVYFGGWKQFMNSQGQKCGNGIQFQQNKFIYRGQFNNGKRNGFGVLKVTNTSQVSTIYIGQFIDGAKHGEGKQINEDNVLYEGEWKDGKKDGFGKLILSKQETYEGTFQQGLKSGHGMEHFKNGDRYQGEYLMGKFHGKGRYYWSNDSVYEGEFKNGMRNGYGVWRSQNNLGDIYEGTYQNDMKNGRGIYRWANGSTYDGEFLNDKKHGKGIIKDENGTILYYEWQNDNMIRKLNYESQPQMLSNTNIRNFNKILPVNRKFSGQREKIQKDTNSKPVFNPNQMKSIRISHSTSNLHRSQSKNRHRHHDQQQSEGQKTDNVIKLHSLAQRPLTSKSSNQSTSNFKLERKSAVTRVSFPKDPPYRTMRSTTNVAQF